ncbi:MAG: hypothetical protein IH787_08780, partial [Nitrospirae bacterium]|nr:hypothetical protein [Nitrospirota bacterium]
PKPRRLVRLVDLAGEYTYDSSDNSRRIAVTMDVELSHDRPIRFLNNTIAAWLHDNAERPGVPYRIIAATIACNPGEMQTVSVTATGDSLSYQWRKDTNPIAGATSASYSIASAVSADSGFFDCVVTGTCDSQTSVAATFTAEVAATITIDPPEGLLDLITNTISISVYEGVERPDEEAYDEDKHQEEKSEDLARLLFHFAP